MNNALGLILFWAALFNRAPQDSDGFGSELDSELWTALDAVNTWPAGDPFAQFP